MSKIGDGKARDGWSNASTRPELPSQHVRMSGFHARLSGDQAEVLIHPADVHWSTDGRGSSNCYSSRALNCPGKDPAHQECSRKYCDSYVAPRHISLTFEQNRGTHLPFLLPMPYHLLSHGRVHRATSTSKLLIYLWRIIQSPLEGILHRIRATIRQREFFPYTFEQ